MAVTHEGFEYARFGDGYVMRKAGSKDDWGTVVGELPAEVQDEFTMKRLRKQGKVTSTRPRTAGTFQGGVSGGAIVKPNKAVEEAAAALGISETEFRQWLNDDQPHQTRKRIPEGDLDAIAQRFKMSPQEIRDRFAGRHNG